ncbi:rod shape determining protein RodA [Thermotomaculum hydrothermale]|uniref:Rod shape determining protein RodA n=1 Tax=Thermotomaculum hydrothermale TaxID=981385 RepID=A0A7R6PPS6_9BACT|nr:rod shape-determining protein RodA [Thermotomaculum hydrothermale]BBB32126.1 rod shape determining protein RodA [Thermotomaculum hydrothermale]
MKKETDWFLIIEVLLLAFLGYITLTSAVITVKGGDIILKKQSVFLVFGFVLAFFFYMIDYRKLLDFVPFIYVATLILLVLTLIIGKVVHGSKSWLNLGFFMLQPSEPGKLVAILTIGYIAKTEKTDYLTFKMAFKIILFVGLLCVLILLQPDFGTASIYIVLLAVVLFVLGLDKKVIIFLIILAMLGGVFAWKYVFKPYQRNRILTVINPERDPLGSGYQVIQSKIAVGSGMIFGKGFKKGTQSKLRYLPEPHTDFIFAVFSEEFGFSGVAVVLALYMLMIVRLINIARVSLDKEGMIMAIGVAAIFFYQGIVSMGMVVGLVPTTGIPLPFFSYGGSGTITYFSMIGLVLNIYRKRFSIL